MFQPAECLSAIPDRLALTRSASAILASALALPLVGCGLNTYRVQDQVAETYNFPDAGSYHKLVVDNGVGDITLIAGSRENGIAAEIVLVGTGSSRENAERALESIDLILAPAADEPGVFVCTSEFPPKWAGHSYKIDWRITAPPSLILDLLTDVGDINASGFTEGVSARSDVGDLMFADILGGVDLRSGVGDIKASAAGPIIASTGVGDVVITVIDDGHNPGYKIDLRSSVGDIEIELPTHSGGLLHASTDVGDVYAEFDDAVAHSVLSRSRHNKLLKVELNNVSAPSIELHAGVGDVEIEFYASDVRR